MIDHVGIYGSRVAEGLSAFNVGLVNMLSTLPASEKPSEKVAIVTWKLVSKINLQVDEPIEIWTSIH